MMHAVPLATMALLMFFAYAGIVCTNTTWIHLQFNEHNTCSRDNTQDWPCCTLYVFAASVHTSHRRDLQFVELGVSHA